MRQVYVFVKKRKEEKVKLLAFCERINDKKAWVERINGWMCTLQYITLNEIELRKEVYLENFADEYDNACGFFTENLDDPQQCISAY